MYNEKRSEWLFVQPAWACTLSRIASDQSMKEKVRGERDGMDSISELDTHWLLAFHPPPLFSHCPRALEVSNNTCGWESVWKWESRREDERELIEVEVDDEATIPSCGQEKRIPPRDL